MSISKMIRDKKKNKLKPDLDDAGQTSVDPNELWDMKQADEVNEATGDEDHMPASTEEMGGDGRSQDVRELKRAMSVVNRYFDSLED